MAPPSSPAGAQCILTGHVHHSTVGPRICVRMCGSLALALWLCSFPRGDPPGVPPEGNLLGETSTGDPKGTLQGIPRWIPQGDPPLRSPIGIAGWDRPRGSPQGSPRRPPRDPQVPFPPCPQGRPKGKPLFSHFWVRKLTLKLC
jgi:hypothetical protein